MKTLEITSVLLLILSGFSCWGQKIENVSFKQKNDSVFEINYDIAGAKPDQAFIVRVHYSTDKGVHYSDSLKFVSGDVGPAVKGGKGKTITWLAYKEKFRIQSKSIKFDVRARIVNKKTEDPKKKTTYTEKVNGVSFDMVYVKGGNYEMGCTASPNICEDNEKPSHRVTIGSFYIGVFEVTQELWMTLMGSNPSSFNDCAKCPVEQVSYSDIVYFLEILNQETGKNYRLPYEAEWEYAARGGALAPSNPSRASGTSGAANKYAGSDNIDEVAWYDKNSGGRTHPAGQKKPNKLGIYDMTGNVFEWCNDWFKSNYYTDSPQKNPTGPATGSFRTRRGGAWGYNAKFNRVSYRLNSITPGGRDNTVGFRLLLAF